MEVLIVGIMLTVCLMSAAGITAAHAFSKKQKPKQ